MISVQEATDLLKKHSFVSKTIEIPFQNAFGFVLAEDILADRDFPPFERVAMDGIAVNSDYLSVGQSFEIEHTQAAGRPIYTLLNPQNAVEVMTGAILPLGTDRVVRYEDLQIENQKATIISGDFSQKNVHKQGSDMLGGEVILAKGKCLQHADIGILASIGKTEVKVFDKVRIQLISTGDEVVAVTEQPLPHQIRASNMYVLESILRANGFNVEKKHLPDNKEALKAAIAEAEKSVDLVLLNGGVSAGKFDFIPSVLAESGFQKVFHKIAQKPGKPLLFAQKSTCFVFGLPGNPASSLICFWRYVWPWLHGQVSDASIPMAVEDLINPLNLTQFIWLDAQYNAIKSGGSGDMVSVSRAVGFIEVPPSTDHKTGVFSFYKI